MYSKPAEVFTANISPQFHQDLHLFPDYPALCRIIVTDAAENAIIKATNTEIKAILFFIILTLIFET